MTKAMMITKKNKLKSLTLLKKGSFKSSHSSGFSLIEISIVLIVVGLILGGVMKGFQLIDSAKIRSLSSQINSYKIATTLFQEKYNALPGDFKRASFELPGSPINGKGQGYIGGPVIGNGSDSSIFWQHLKLSGLIDDGTINEEDPSGNFYPKTKLGGFVSITYRPHNLSGHWFVIADQINGNVVPLLTPKQAFELDKLTDSGNPKTGNMRSFDGPDHNSKCLKSGGGYNLNNKDRACMVYIKL